MKPLPSLSFPRHQVCPLENREVLGDSLTRHIEALAQISECLPIFLVQAVKELPAASIRQSLEKGVISHFQ